MYEDRTVLPSVSYIGLPNLGKASDGVIVLDHGEHIFFQPRSHQLYVAGLAEEDGCMNWSHSTETRK